MKTLKLILLALLMMAGFAANAQTIQIYKNGVVVKEYDAAAVDSVIYKPAEAQPKYYYYAGWECPTDETELASKGIEIKNYTSMTTGTVIKDYITDELVNTSYKKYYVVVPSGCGVYSADGTNVTFDFQNTQTKQFGSVEYVIIESDYEEKRIDSIIIKKK